jgi:hypothetical protein
MSTILETLNEVVPGWQDELRYYLLEHGRTYLESALPDNPTASVCIALSIADLRREVEAEAAARAAAAS